MNIILSVSSVWYYINTQKTENPAQFLHLGVVRWSELDRTMLTYVYIGSVGPFENVYVNKIQKGPENSWNISEIVP